MPRRAPRTARPQRPKERALRSDGRPAGSRSRSFRCVGCRLDVGFDAPGTVHRNHCPSCLTSRHVDRTAPGDRASPCGGRMRPIGVTVRDGGEWQIIHACRACGALSANRVAGDDNPVALLRLAMRPLAGAVGPARVLLGPGDPSAKRPAGHRTTSRRTEHRPAR